MDTFLQFLPIIIITSPLALGNAYLAKKMKKSIPLWLVLSLIPGFNYFFAVYAAYTTAFYLLDRVNKLSNNAGITAQIFE